MAADQAETESDASYANLERLLRPNGAFSRPQAQQALTHEKLFGILPSGPVCTALERYLTQQLTLLSKKMEQYYGVEPLFGHIADQELWPGIVKQRKIVCRQCSTYTCRLG